MGKVLRGQGDVRLEGGGSGQGPGRGFRGHASAFRFQPETQAQPSKTALSSSQGAWGLLAGFLIRH